MSKVTWDRNFVYSAYKQERYLWKSLFSVAQCLTDSLVQQFDKDILSLFDQDEVDIVVALLSSY